MRSGGATRTKRSRVEKWHAFVQKSQKASLIQNKLAVATNLVIPDFDVHVTESSQMHQLALNCEQVFLHRTMQGFCMNTAQTLQRPVLLALLKISLGEFWEPPSNDTGHWNLCWLPMARAIAEEEAYAPAGLTPKPK